jgi:magnesium chelatase family protein
MSHNVNISPAEVRQFCKLDESSHPLRRSAMNQLHLSAHACHRILKLARTIADLESSEYIQKPPGSGIVILVDNVGSELT